MLTVSSLPHRHRLFDCGDPETNSLDAFSLHDLRTPPASRHGERQPETMASENVNDEGPAWEGELGDGDGNDEYQPDIQLSDEQTQDATVHAANPSADYGDYGEEDLGDDGADYDPEAISAPAPMQSDSKSKPTPPRTTGGFIVSDDSDSEEEEGTTGDAKGDQQPADTSNASVGGDQAAPSEPHFQDAQVTNGSPAGQVAAHPAPPAQAVDRTTALEARVKQDPRGDMDAWLDLIEEYRKHSTMEPLRSVYNRFLEVFPQSVSLTGGMCIFLLFSPLTRRVTGRSLGVLG